jgi:hypothetical protein
MSTRSLRMLPSAQIPIMVPAMAAQALMRHSIGRSWRRSLAGGYPDALLGLLRSFRDVPDPSSPFSVHNLCADGAAYGCADSWT